MLFGSTDLRPWLVAAVLAAAAIGGLSLGPAGPPAFAADSPPPPPATTTTPTTTPAPETAPVTTTPAPDKAPVPPPKTKTTPATPTRPARTQKAPYVPPPVSSGTVAPRAVVPLQPVRPVVKRPAQLSAKAKAQAQAKVKALALALAQQQAQAKELARAQAQANARARAKAQAELAAILSLPWMPREPVSAAGSPPTLSFAPTDSSVRLRAVTLLLASLGIALLALAALGAPVLGVAGRHPGAATALYDRRTEIALAGVSLLVGITILAALTRWMT